MCAKMAYRGIRGCDPFASKTTRNERFAQMSKQEQLIEQKKREIQAKLEDQKKKETEEALKKLQAVPGNSRQGAGNRSNSQSGQHKGNRKSFWKSNQDQRWKRDTSHSEDVAITKVQGSVNIFSNDGSFLDQFKKLSGVKETKPKKGDDSSNANSNVGSDTKASTSALLSSSKCDSDTDWGTWGASTEKHTEEGEDRAEGTELGASEDQEGNQDRNKDRDQNDEDLQNSERLGTSHWFQQKCVSSGSWQEQGQGNCGVGWHGQGSPSPPLSRVATTVPNRSSSPYSPSSAIAENKELVAAVNITAPTSKGPVQYSLPNIHPPPIMPLLNPPQQQFIAYSSPPPQLQSIPPLSSMQPHTIPTPPPLTTALSIHSISTPVIPQPPPAIPQPPPTLQQPLPSIQPSSPSLPPHLMQHAVPLLQHHTVPPPGVIQTQGLGTASMSTLMTPLLQHPVPPLGLPPAAPAPASACPPPAAVLSICTSGTGVSPAVVGVMQASRPNGGQSTDGPADPAADEARNYLARTVAQCGDDIEQIILVRNPDDPTLWFLNDKESAAYLQYRQLVEKFRLEMKNTDGKGDVPNSELKVETDSHVKQEQSEYGPISFEPESTPSTKREQPDDTTLMTQGNIGNCKQDQEDDSSQQSKVSSKRSGDESDEGQAGVPRRRKRRSRWAPEAEKVPVVAGNTIIETGGACASAAVNLQSSGTITSGVATSTSGQLLTKVTRTDPALIQYAVQAFGTSNLSEDDWKKAEDHYKINLLYQDMLRKRQELERLQRAGKFKYEYDSDEETDGGTWEHRLRLQEMEATQRWAEELTKKAEGKHHIGDFLPPDELERFLEKYNALKEGREPDLSDYKEFKLKEDNIGFQMLQKLGWTEGQGLGSEGHGIVDPVNKASSRPENQGLGVERPEDVSHGDDEYDAYRKRMMLAYRFRPNPLNNPRRPYY